MQISITIDDPAARCIHKVGANDMRQLERCKIIYISCRLESNVTSCVVCPKYKMLSEENLCTIRWTACSQKFCQVFVSNCV